MTIRILTTRRALMSSGCALGLIFTPMAMAQTETPEEDATVVLDTVTVSVMRRETTLQDVSASASVVSSEQAELLGLSDVESLSNVIPNLNFGEHDGASFVTIRGVGASVEIGIGEPSVATYIDGVFLPRQTMGFLSQTDLNRIEVIRGPQGTLYGRNATGGAINFVSEAPSETFNGSLRAGAGSFDAFNIGGHVSGPISENVRYRLSAEHDTNEGYVDNLLTVDTIGGRDLLNIRGALQIDLSDKTVVDAFIQYQESDGETAWQQTLTPSLSPLIPPGFQESLQPNEIYSDQGYAAQQETLIASVAITHEFSDNLSLKSTTSYIDHTSSATFDGDATDYGLVDVVGFERPSESWSQEFVLSGQSERLDWLIGAFYFDEEFQAVLPAVLPAGLPALAAPPTGLPAGTINFQELNEDTTSYALFADIEFAVTDRLSLLAGARMNWEEKDFSQSLGAIIPGAGFFGAADVPSSREDDEFLPKIGLSFDVTEGFKTYVQYQKGLKSGGQNLGILSTQYEPELIDAYEAGFRSSWANGDLVVNGAAFFYDYQDYQVTDLPGGTATVVQNSDAEITGLEVEFVGQVTDAFRLSGGLTLLDSEYTDFTSLDLADPFVGPQDLAGRTLNRAPEFTANVIAQYTFPVADGLTLSGDIYHSDDVVLRYFGTNNDVQDAYTVANLSAVLNLRDGGLQLKAFGRNLGDEDIKRVVIFSPLQGAYLGNYAPGQTWGVEAVVRF